MNATAPHAPTATRAHVAIVHEWVAHALLQGEKTIESRFARDRRPPFGRIASGDTVYFRVAGGSYAAHAVVRRVLCEQGLTPAKVRTLEAQHRSAIGGDEAYWRRARSARCVTLLWLGPCRPVDSGPTLDRQRGDRRAWFSLG